ncbi:hypothetical protein GOV07_00780 [Candidatus Woesearchaeota archaeon]|nr:hypothetical protein [Candidatus Woesearchaeota archaeon]
MLLTLLFGLVNFGVTFFGRRFVKLPGFDLTPIGMIILARAGENIFFAALVLTVAYSFPKIGKMRYLWLTVPATILIGFLAVVVENVFLLLAIYHVVCFVFALLIGFFGFRYFIFVLVNFGLNFAVARLYAFFA